MKKRNKSEKYSGGYLLLKHDIYTHVMAFFATVGVSQLDFGVVYR